MASAFEASGETYWLYSQLQSVQNVIRTICWYAVSCLVQIALGLKLGKHFNLKLN